MKSIVFTPAATRQWTRLAAATRHRINNRLETFAASGHGDVRKLKGRAGARLRISDWRIIFYEQGDAIIVVAVGHRREIYDREEAMNVKFTMTAKGEMATLPRADYERLKKLAQEAEEDVGMARLVARAKKDIAGGEPFIPKEVADRLANDENPIRVLREFRECSQAEFVAAIGITQGYLSDLETGKRKGPLELHQKIARALGVPLELLAPVKADAKRVTKRKQVGRQMRRLRS